MRLGYSDRTGLRLGLLFGLATIAWPYATQFFGEPLSAFSLLLVVLSYAILSWKTTGRTRWMLCAGIGAGIALATVTAHALLLALLGAYAVAAWWLRRRAGLRIRCAPRHRRRGLRYTHYDRGRVAPALQLGALWQRL